MCTMKQACEHLGITYETLRFYCDEGLVPNVRRGKNNYRDFDERNLRWIESLLCLRRCGMSVSDMKEYMTLCLEGAASIPQRKDILALRRDELAKQIEALQSSIAFIDAKQQFFDDIIDDKIPYTSNLIDLE